MVSGVVAFIDDSLGCTHFGSGLELFHSTGDGLHCSTVMNRWGGDPPSTLTSLTWGWLNAFRKLVVLMKTLFEKLTHRRLPTPPTFNSTALNRWEGDPPPTLPLLTLFRLLGIGVRCVCVRLLSLTRAEGQSLPAAASTRARERASFQARVRRSVAQRQSNQSQRRTLAESRERRMLTPSKTVVPPYNYILFLGIGARCVCLQLQKSRAERRAPPSSCVNSRERTCEVSCLSFPVTAPMLRHFLSDK